MIGYKIVSKSQILSFGLKHLRSVVARWLVLHQNFGEVWFFFSYETTFGRTGLDHLSCSETKELFKSSCSNLFKILLLKTTLQIIRSNIISIYMQNKHINGISAYADSCFTGFNENLKIRTDVLCGNKHSDRFV